MYQNTKSYGFQLYAADFKMSVFQWMELSFKMFRYRPVFFKKSIDITNENYFFKYRVIRICWTTGINSVISV